MTLYQPTFLTQFDGGPFAKSNCTPTSAAMAADQSTGGAVRRTGSEIRALLATHEETNPATPGWSLPDARKALSRIGVSLWVPSGGAAWTELLRLRAEGRGIVLQGDSDQFADNTCSGAFDGDHAVYLPAEADSSASEWTLGDPICRRFRQERQSVIRAYADKFARARRLPAGNVSFGYTGRVPEEEAMLDITDTKGEDWRPRVERKPVRDRPDRVGGTIVGYIEVGAIVRTIAEGRTSDGNVWRLTEFNGRPGWILRSDFDPLVQGGDPATDALLTDYIARHDLVTSTVVVTGQGLEVSGP